MSPNTTSCGYRSQGDAPIHLNSLGCVTTVGLILEYQGRLQPPHTESGDCFAECGVFLGGEFTENGDWKVCSLI